MPAVRRMVQEERCHSGRWRGADASHPRQPQPAIGEPGGNQLPESVCSRIDRIFRPHQNQRDRHPRVPHVKLPELGMGSLPKHYFRYKWILA